MGRRRAGLVFGVWVLLVFVAVFGVVLNIPVVKSNGTPRTWTVDDDGPADFSKIQDAVNAASPGDTIYVFNGTYYENVVVNKNNLTLVGENREATIIDGGGNLSAPSVVYVETNNTIITGFTMQKSGSYYDLPLRERAAIYLHYSHNVSIHNNRASNNGWDGVHLDHSNNVSIHNNKANNNSRDGVHLENSYNVSIYYNDVTNNYNHGIYLQYSHNVSVHHNDASHESYNGVWLGYSYDISIYNNKAGNNGRAGIEMVSSYNISVYNNNINNNKVPPGGFGASAGILLGYSFNNSIHNNTFTDNHISGIWLFGPSDNNRIYHNNFINNTNQVGLDGSTNVWDDGYPSGGNYWSDYNGTDIYSGPNQDQPGSDGIGDDPYVIGWDTDRYPLMNPSGPDFTSPATSHNCDSLWHTIDFIISLIATDDYSGVAETYYKINDGPTQNVSTHGQPSITTESANNTLEYWSIDNAGNEETHHILTGIKLDKTAPTGSITINNGDAYTTSTSVTLTLTSNDATSGVYQVRYSNDGVWDTETWETPSTTKTWTLTLGDGTKTVYYQIKDNAGLVSITYSDTIILDTTSPSGYISINDGATYTTTTSVTLTLSATDATSGIAEMRFSDNGADWTLWEAYTTLKPWTLPAGDGTKTVHVQFKDNAGLISQSYSDTIILDTTAPTGSVTIAEGADYTNSTSVTLTLSADDETSGVAQMRFSNDNISWSSWEAYASSKAWTLTTGDGTKTVYAQFMDNAGLTSPIYQDTITLDTAKPTANAGVDQTVNEDTLVTLDASASTDENGIATYTWTFTDVTPQTLTGKNPTYTFATPGTYTITLKVTDQAGNTATDTVIITVFDITKPVANAGSDRTVNEDTSITFDGSGSLDNVAIISYTWTFTDVTTKALTGEKPTYTFNTPGVYTITLNVTDAAGNWATDTITITVLDITKPVANAGQDQTVNVGEAVSFDASGSTDNVGIVSHEWDFGDGTTGAGKTTTHAYASGGTYTVTLTVKDAAGNTATHQITVTVLPTEPVPLWVLGVAAAIIGIGIATTAAIIWKKRK